MCAVNPTPVRSYIKDILSWVSNTQKFIPVFQQEITQKAREQTVRKAKVWQNLKAQTGNSKQLVSVLWIRRKLNSTGGDIKHMQIQEERVLRWVES